MVEKKYLIASGCSFTQGHHLGERGSWATYFAKNNNLELINLGFGGGGNESIITQLIQYSKINKDISENAIFGIQLSECLRTLTCIDFPNDSRYPKYWHITPAQFIKEDGFDGWDLSQHHNKFLFDNRYTLAPFYMNVTNSVLITINAIIGFIDFCKSNNYPFFIFDGLSKVIPVKTDKSWKLINRIDNKDYWDVDVSDEMDTECFYSKSIKPIIHEKIINYINSIKEYHQIDDYKSYLFNLGIEEFNNFDYYFIGNQGHPNEEGSKKWAEYLQNIIW